MKKIAIVILNWNGRNLLEKFLPFVVKYNSAEADIVIADNASSDDSAAFLEKNYPAVRLIRLAQNFGFAKGYNEALKQVQADYYVLLNSDVEVTPGWLDPVIEMMDRNPSIGAAQPKILSYNQRTQFEYAGAAGGFIDKYGFPFCRGRIFNSFEEDSGQYDDEKEIFWATGACLFIRAPLYHEAGGLDEDFFAHMEEIDLCWRIKNLGHRVMYCPRSKIYHVGGGTLSKVSPQKTFLNFRNNMILLFKNHSPEYFLVKVFLRGCLDMVAALKFLLSGQPGHFLAVLRAHASFDSTIGRSIRKRKEMKKRIRHYTDTAVYRGIIVFDYYLKGKKKFSELDKNKF